MLENVLSQLTLFQQMRVQHRIVCRISSQMSLETIVQGRERLTEELQRSLVRGRLTL